jgi:hypothetical protein
MRAERFRAWRIRSPSWRNELIENEHSSKSPAALPGFFFLVSLCAEPSVRDCCASVFLLDAILPHLKHGALLDKSSHSVIKIE